MSTTRKIAAGSAILIAGNALGYALALLKEVLVAARFGVGSGMDAFYAAFTVPSLISGVFLATFTAVFIPVFTACRAKTPEHAKKLSDVFITWLTVFLLACSLGLFLLAGPLISLFFPGFRPEQAGAAAALLRQLSWLALLSGGVGMAMGVLSVYRDFSSQAFAPLFVTGAIMASVALFGGSLGVASLSWGTLAGVLLEFLFLAWFVRRSGFRFSPDFDGRDPELRAMLALIPTFLAAAAMGQVNLVVDRFMASGLSAGSIAALGYADKLVHVPTQVFNASITTAAFPFFAALAASDDMEELKTTLASLVRIAAFVLIPATALLVLTSGSVIRLLFERGAFGPAATSLTSVIFSMYCLQLFFTAVQVLVIRVFLALKEMRVLVLAAAASTVLNISLNLLLMRLIDPPAAGIALSTSLTEFLVTLGLFRLLRRRIGPLQTLRMLDGIKKTALASLLTAAAAVPFYKLVINAAALQGAAVRGLALAGFALAWAAAFFWVCGLVKLEETDKIKTLVRSKLGLA